MMSTTRAAAIGTAVAVVLAGCGGTAGSHRGTQPPPPRVTPPMPKHATANRFAHGLPTTHPSTQAVPPPAPGTPGGLAVASIPAVVGLHDLASAVGRPLGVPAGALTGEATDLTRRLSAVRAQVGQSPSGPAARLGVVIDGYSRFAQRVAHQKARIGPSAISQLRALDAEWKAALDAIGHQQHQNLLALVPNLLIPSPATAPAPRPIGG